MAMLVVLLLVTGVMAGVTTAKPRSRPSRTDGPTFEELKQMVAALELDLAEAVSQLSSVLTLCAVNQDRRANLLDRTLPFILAENARQQDTIDDFNDQIKAVVHRVDKYRADAAETKEIADETQTLTTEITNSISQIAQKNVDQQTEIDDLENSIDVIKQQFLTDLQDDIQSVEGQLATEVQETLTLASTVEGRKCEYGTAILGPGVSNVTFITSFTSAPVVSLQLTSFKFDLAKHESYPSRHGHDNKPDLLALDKYVTSTSTDGFSVTLMGDTQGSVELVKSACSWAACQGFF